MLFWLIALAVVVLGTLAWWTSRRSKRRGIDLDKTLRGSEKTQGDLGMQSGRPLGGGPGGPLNGGGGGV